MENSSFIGFQANKLTYEGYQMTFLISPGFGPIEWNFVWSGGEVFLPYSKKMFFSLKRNKQLSVKKAPFGQIVVRLKASW